jgi:hypothetical protein
MQFDYGNGLAQIWYTYVPGAALGYTDPPRNLFVQ